MRKSARAALIAGVTAATMAGAAAHADGVKPEPAHQPARSRDVVVPDDPLQSFFASGYRYCDAKLLGDFWDLGILESKLTIGRKINNGIGYAVPGILSMSRNAGHACEWSDIGYTYADAEQLAAIWGLNDPYDAKLEVARLFTNGKGEIVERILGR
jgi:hypothetical protein